MLLLVGDEILEIRPQQIVIFESEIKNKFLKRIYTKPSPPKKVQKKKNVMETNITIKEIKLEKTDGSSSSHL